MDGYIIKPMEREEERNGLINVNLTGRDFYGNEDYYYFIQPGLRSRKA